MVYTVKFVVKKHSISSIYVKTVSSIISKIIWQNTFRTPHFEDSINPRNDDRSSYGKNVLTFQRTFSIFDKKEKVSSSLYKFGRNSNFRCFLSQIFILLIVPFGLEFIRMNADRSSFHSTLIYSRESREYFDITRVWKRGDARWNNGRSVSDSGSGVAALPGDTVALHSK